MSYSHADKIPPKIIENGVVVPPGLQVGEMTLHEHQEYLVWLQMRPKLTRVEAIAAGHRPQEVYEYFGPLPEGPPVAVALGPVIDAVVASRNTTELQDVRGEARSMGFTGDICIVCGSPRMVNNGTCLLCQSCGSTTGCS